MTHLLVQQVEKKQIKSDVPEIHPGYTVKVFQKIKEGDKERIQSYEGLVIAVNHGHGSSKTMTVRRIVEGIGVEKIFPIHSPNISKIEIVRIGKVRRSKLYYMRDVSGKAARLREMLVGEAAEVKTAKAEEKSARKAEKAAKKEAVKAAGGSKAVKAAAKAAKAAEQKAAYDKSKAEAAAAAAAEAEANKASESAAEAPAENSDNTPSA